MSPTRKKMVAGTVLIAATGLAIAAIVRSSGEPVPARVVAEVAVPDRPVPAAQSAPAPAPTPSPVTPSPTPTPFVVKRILADGGPITFGNYLWDETDAPAGPIVITVDVAAQTLSVFRDGYEIGASAILYGADEKPTPLGTFPISQKDAHHFSRTYDNAPMPYALRLTGDGVFIHGSKVEWGYATHGCIGVPVAFAKKLFAVAGIGDRVIITRGKSLAMGDPITA